MKIPDLVLGSHALTGQKLKIPFDELKRHWHVLGRTGKGKTKALEILARHIIDAQHGLVVLDGKGDLFEAIRDYCVASRCEDRVVIVDPTEQRWAVGINYLEVIGETAPETLAEMVMEGLKKCFGEEDEFKPLLEEWNPAALLPLIQAKLTLCELEEIANIADPTFRKAVFKTLGAEGERLAKKWEGLRAFGEREAAIRTAVVRTRGAIIRNSPMAEAMFGQVKTTIDWRKVLDQGGIVLVRAHRHPKISERLRTLLGVTVMHQLLETAFSRARDDRRDAWLMADEFQQFACQDFVDGLAQLRSFRLWLILSNQELKQLEPVEGLKEAVLAECSGKIYFSLSHLDAEETVHELFQGDIHGQQVKHKILQTKFWPVETTREIESESRSTGETAATGSSESESASDALAEALSSTESFSPDGIFFPTLRGTAETNSASHSSSEGTVQGWSESSSTSSSHSQGKTVVPWYEYRPFLEESGRQFYTIEEVVERLKGWLMLQSSRKAQLKIGDRKTIPLVTKTVKEVVVLEEEIKEFLERVMPRCALPTEEVRKVIAERVRLFIERYKEAIQQEEAKEAEAKKAKDAEFQASQGLLGPPGLPPPINEPLPPKFEPAEPKKKRKKKTDSL